MTKRFTLAFALASTACGNAVADGSYKGQPLVTLNGRVGLASSNVPPIHPSVGLIWYTPLDGGQVANTFGGTQGLPGLVGELAPISAASFPASFDFQIFDPPPASALQFLSVDGGDLAVAFVAAVDDVNGDGTFALKNEVITYACTDDACTLPAGNWVTVLDQSFGDSPDSGLPTGSAVVVEVAPPDRLLGLSPDFYLLYDTGNTEIVAKGLSQFGDSSELAQPGYHLLNVCLTPVTGCTSASCAGENQLEQIVSDSAAVDIGPGGLSGASSIPACNSASVCGAGFGCAQGCEVTPPTSASGVCTCVPEDPNISGDLMIACTSDADCCTGTCQAIDQGQGQCSWVGGTGPSGAATTTNTGGVGTTGTGGSRGSNGPAAATGTSGVGTTGGSTTSGGATTGGSTTSGGATTGGSSGTTGSSQCNGSACVQSGVTNVGAVVPLEQVAAAEPIAQGGSLPPAGTYVLTAAQVYDGSTGPTGDTYQETLVLSGILPDGSELFQRLMNDDGCPASSGGVLEPLGTLLTMDQQCPAADSFMLGYSLLSGPGATAFQVFFADLALTYTLQP